MALSPKEVHELKSFATEIRLNTLETLNHLGFGHYGGSLSHRSPALSPRLLRYRHPAA